MLLLSAATVAVQVPADPAFPPKACTALTRKRPSFIGQNSSPPSKADESLWIGLGCDAVLSVREPACLAMFRSGKVVPGKSWGSLGPVQKTRWLELKCDGVVAALLGNGRTTSGSRPKAPTPPSSDHLINEYEFDPATSDFYTHTVSAGDTLTSIAKAANISPGALLRDNDIRYPEDFRIGTVLRMRRDAPAKQAPSDGDDSSTSGGEGGPTGAPSAWTAAQMRARAALYPRAENAADAGAVNGSSRA